MEKPVHFRRCHMCGAINEVFEGKVEKCIQCTKSLAPFYYFDDRLAVIATDSELRTHIPEREYAPIHGLTAYWEGF